MPMALPPDRVGDGRRSLIHFHRLPEIRSGKRRDHHEPVGGYVPRCDEYQDPDLDPRHGADDRPNLTEVRELREGEPEDGDHDHDGENRLDYPATLIRFLGRAVLLHPPSSGGAWGIGIRGSPLSVARRTGTMGFGRVSGVGSERSVANETDVSSSEAFSRGAGG